MSVKTWDSSQTVVVIKLRRTSALTHFPVNLATTYFNAFEVHRNSVVIDFVVGKEVFVSSV